jgi:hypothetical protein
MNCRNFRSARMANLAGKNARCQMSTEGPVTGRRVETKLENNFFNAGRGNSGSVSGGEPSGFARARRRQAREQVKYRFADAVGQLIDLGRSGLGVGL